MKIDPIGYVMECADYTMSIIRATPGEYEPHAVALYTGAQHCVEKSNGWRPIATVPKETEVLIGAFIDGKFKWGRSELFYEHANEFEGETFSGWVWSIDYVSDSVAESPTHWQPLPPAPEAA